MTATTRDFASGEGKAGVQLVLLLLKQQHPKPVAHAELKNRFIALIREHGTAQAALDHLTRTMRQ